MVRLMIFNVKAGNQDDLSKNFSFCMNADHRCHFSLAYALTPCTGINGEHCSTVNGKGKEMIEQEIEALREI